jgi:hypothetical protein
MLGKGLRHLVALGDHTEGANQIQREVLTRQLLGR